VLLLSFSALVGLDIARVTLPYGAV
jgi:hypothetical protein